ncbi:MFS transporter [Hasllibacter halocynthiae]|uniref:MFS transporter n=1 Tax=Hasllibacter halocynthiae TaxID=595589 RepID=UPI001304BB88|nr:MFS transporter [Hasllibacter halocynthiae]
MRFGQKLAFGTPEVGLALAFVAINSWLLYFLVNVAGLSPLLAGIAFLAGRLFDAVLDPLVGRWSDRMRHTVGRIPAIRWALVPTALAYVSIWVLPALVEPTVLKFALATGGFMLFSFFYTLVSIPRIALLPDLVPDYDARTGQVSINMIFIFVSVLVAIAITPALVIGFTGVEELAATPAFGWIATAALFAVLGILSYLPFLFAIPDAQPSPAPPVRPLGADVRSLFATPGYGRVIAIFGTSVLATLIVQSMVPFYLESWVGLPGSAQAPILGGIFLLSILCFPAWASIGKRMGKHRAMILGCAIYCLFLALVPFVPRASMTPFLIGICALSGIGISAINLFPWAMLPDAVDMDAQTHGAPREGLVYAVFIFTQKMAGSLAVFWNAIMLAIFDHQAGRAVQAEGTLAAFVWMTGPIPLAILVVTILLCIGYPITRAMQARARAGTTARNVLA